MLLPQRIQTARTFPEGDAGKALIQTQASGLWFKQATSLFSFLFPIHKHEDILQANSVQRIAI